MSISVRQRGEGYNQFIHIPFRRCKADDFIKRGIIETEKTLKLYERSHFCPEFDKFQDLVKVKNLYNDAKERVSFAVEIYRCDPKKRRCENVAKIERFLKQFHVTLSTIIDRIEYSEDHLVKSSLKDMPVKTLLKFHSQFQLSTTKYRDNNNFLQINKGEHNEHRYNPFVPDSPFIFLDYT